MSAQHTPATHLLLDWLTEREANARRIAKTAPDREGWLEDAEYFKAAAARAWEHAEAIAALKDVLRIATAASVGVSGNQPRLERARTVLSKIEGTAA